MRIGELTPTIDCRDIGIPTEPTSRCFVNSVYTEFISIHEKTASFTLAKLRTD